MSGICLITNPRSRRNRRDPDLARRLDRCLGSQGELVQPGDLEALAEVARRAREQAVEVVAINGGDGTVHQVLSALARAYGQAPLPRLALLRGGTMNTLARGMGIRGQPLALLEAIVRARAEGIPIPRVRRSVLCVDGEQHGFLFGTGLIARFLEAYYEGSEPSPAKALWVLARAIASTLVGGELSRELRRPLCARVRLDGSDWQEGEFSTVAAGTVDDIGMGFRPFYRSLECPGQLHAVTVGPELLPLVRALPRIYRARPLPGPDPQGAVGKELRVEAESPISYMVDGDFHRGGCELRVQVGPEVEVLCPGQAFVRKSSRAFQSATGS